MDSTESRSLDWKVCFKEILAPELLSTTNMEEQTDAPHPSNASNGEEQNGAQYNTVNPKNDEVNSTVSLENAANSADAQKKNFINKKRISSVTAKAAQVNKRSQSFIEAFRHCPYSDTPGTEVSDSENAEEEEIAKIVAADAEELANNFKELKLKEKELAENTRKPPKWKHTFKKVPDPAYFLEPSERQERPLTSDEVRDEALAQVRVAQRGGRINLEFLCMHQEVIDYLEGISWSYQEPRRGYDPLEDQELIAWFLPEYADEKKHLTYKERRSLRILSSFCVNPKKKTQQNNLDGADDNGFKDNERNSTENASSSPEKPKNAPAARWVCVHTYKEGPPIIPSEPYWDDDLLY